jgi:hypothetical protein
VNEAIGRLRAFLPPFPFKWAALCLILPAIAGAQTSYSASTQDGCAALIRLNLKDAQCGPALVTSARMMDVPGGIRRTESYPSGYSDGISHRWSEVWQYCDVTGYVAPQNKFELKLPLARNWNGNFFFNACGGFCGGVLSGQCDLGLMRGYASATGNGGHERAPGFDGIWAANAPELQEDFGWRSNHVVTLITKTITMHYYGKPIQHAFIAGNSKGGQAVRRLHAKRAGIRLHWPEHSGGGMVLAGHLRRPWRERTERRGGERSPQVGVTGLRRTVRRGRRHRRGSAFLQMAARDGGLRADRGRT